MKLSANYITQDLIALGDPATAEHSQRFFRTAKGKYGEGGQYIGLRVPVIRKAVKKYKTTSLDEVN